MSFHFIFVTNFIRDKNPLYGKLTLILHSQYSDVTQVTLILHSQYSDVI